MMLIIQIFSFLFHRDQRSLEKHVRLLEKCWKMLWNQTITVACFITYSLNSLVFLDVTLLMTVFCYYLYPPSLPIPCIQLFADEMKSWGVFHCVALTFLLQMFCKSQITYKYLVSDFTFAHQIKDETRLFTDVLRKVVCKRIKLTSTVKTKSANVR